MNNYSRQYRQINSNVSLEVSGILRNTFILLGFSIITTALSSYFSIVLSLPIINPIFFLVGIFAFNHAVTAFQNSSVGILMMLLYSAFLGYALSHTIFFLLQTPFGYKVLLESLSTTAVVFFGLTLYATASRKNFSFMGGFITVMFVAVLASILVSFFFQSTILELVISGFIVLLSSSLILYKISEIIHGGERNYIVAALSIYISIYNIFTSLIRIFGSRR
jgi:modulator of FtsH protease